MGISDVLWEANETIREYLDDKELGFMYDDLRPQIEELLKQMEAMRICLDNPQTKDELS